MNGTFQNVDRLHVASSRGVLGAVSPSTSASQTSPRRAWTRGSRPLYISWIPSILVWLCSGCTQPADSVGWVSSFATSSQDARIAYYEISDAPDTVPLIVVSGGPGSDHRYMHAGGAFSRLANSRRVVMFDQRATGQSSPAPESSRIDHWIEDIEAIRQAIGTDSIDLLGHSFGGYLAMSYAAMHPDRARSLILVASAAPTPSENIQLINQVYPDRVERWSTLRASLPSSFPAETMAVFFSMEFADPKWIDRYTEHVRGLRYDIAINNVLRQDMARRDLKSKVHTLTQPVLLLHGRFDAILAPAVSWALHQSLPTSRLRIFERSGHMPFIEEPDEFTDAVTEFLASVDTEL